MDCMTLEQLQTEPRETAHPPTPARWLRMSDMYKILRDNPLKAWPEAVYREKVIDRSGLLAKFFVVNDLDWIGHILQGNQENYPKSVYETRVLKPALGKGMLTSEGAVWRPQRKVAAPAFQHKKLQAFAPTMTAAAQQMAGIWQQHPTDEPRDIAEDMIHMTYRIISETMFSSDADAEAGAMSDALTLYFNTVGRVGLADFLGLPDWWPDRDKAAARPALKQFKASIDRIVENRKQRRQSKDEGVNDLLGMLLAAREPERGAALSRQQIHDNLLTFIAAGHETTANALSWTYYLLATHPDAQKKWQQDLDSVVGSRDVSVTDLPDLTFGRMVLDEAMRLYPPAPFMVRTAAKDDEIQGHAVKKGTHLYIAPYFIHRHHAYWEKPAEFWPERFHPDAKKTIHRYQYMPFGAGPRICIGAGFAIQEALLIMATLSKKFTLHLAPNQNVEALARITLRPRDGLKMFLTPR